MHREAAAPSRAVLLATHQPPQIRRVRVTEAGRYGTEDLVTQETLLETVANASDQALIVPVIGAAGSGKSHLVLWLRASLEAHKDPNRKIIYLPKGETRLDRVIDLILDNRTGSPFDEIRQAVANATRAMGTDEAARRLRDELSVAVSKFEPSGSDLGIEEFRQHLRENLPDLLDDPVYSQRLVGSGGPLWRIVEQASIGGNEEPVEIKPADLDIQLTAAALEELSKPAKTLLGDLQAVPALHETAAAMVNELLPRCLMRVFGIEPMQLVAVMHELRAKLLEENPDLELILMIEDFTLLQGIQHDLLEAMIDPPRREGRTVMCGMKTVMAVTDGFFTRVLASSDTLRTRLAAQGHVYNLDVDYGADTESAIDPDALADFAGRYLNAVRIGAADIDEAAPVVHNACEVCAHRDRCHASFEAAGATEHGLYPFNPAALDRMVRSRQGKFNPRDLLAVISMTLTQHRQEIEDGGFPSDAWARNFDASQFDRPAPRYLSLRVQQEVEQTPKAEQRLNLLTFWGAAPDELRNLPTGIHEAFDIPPLSGVKIEVPHPEKPAVNPTPQSDRGGHIDQLFQSWREGQRLEIDSARIVRRLLRDAILAAVDPENELISEQFVKGFFDKDTDIAIENSAGSGKPGPERFRVELDATNENALLLSGLLKMQQQGSWAINDGERGLIAFLARVDRESQRLRVFLRDRLEQRQDDRRAAIASLAVSGLIAGRGSPGSSRGLLAAALGAGGAAASDAQPPRWRALLEMSAKHDDAVKAFVLQGAHVSKSTADAAGVDGQQFDAALRGVAEDWTLPKLSEDAPRQATALRLLLESRLELALEEAHDSLVAWRASVSRLAGEPDSITTRSRQWLAAIEAARSDGFLVQARNSTSETTPSQLAATIRFVNGVVDQWSDMSLGRRIAAIAAVPWRRLVPLVDYLSAIEKTLTMSLERARSQYTEQGGESPVVAFERALDRLDSAARLTTDRAENVGA